MSLSLVGVCLTIRMYLSPTENVLPAFHPNTTKENRDYQVDVSRCLWLTGTSKISIIRNGIDTLVCWIFLVVVTRSPRFVGCSTIIKNLIRLAKFWTLVCLLVLYIGGGVLATYFFNSCSHFFGSPLKDPEATKTIYVTEVVMEILNVFTKVALVGVLNHVQVRNVARSGFKYWLLKGTLIVTCIFQFCTFINTIMTVSFLFRLPVATGNSYAQQVGPFINDVMELLLLSIVTKIGALIWTKIWHDNKYILGNNERYESNSFTRQNPRISNAIDFI